MHGQRCNAGRIKTVSHDETTPVNDHPEEMIVTDDDTAADVTPSPDDDGVPTALSDSDAAVSEAEKNLQGWQRTLAEFQNYKRRVERESKEIRQKTALDTLVKMLPIIDDFERALASLPDDMKDNPWINGVTLIQSKFQKLLEEYEVSIIDPVGELFDPNQHEAVGRDDDTDVESGHVSATLQKGYQCGERVLRPALVRVAS